MARAPAPTAGRRGGQRLRRSPLPAMGTTAGSAPAEHATADPTGTAASATGRGGSRRSPDPAKTPGSVPAGPATAARPASARPAIGPGAETQPDQRSIGSRLFRESRLPMLFVKTFLSPQGASALRKNLLYSPQIRCLSACSDFPQSVCLPHLSTQMASADLSLALALRAGHTEGHCLCQRGDAVRARQRMLSFYAKKPPVRVLFCWRSSSYGNKTKVYQPQSPCCVARKTGFIQKIIDSTKMFSHPQRTFQKAGSRSFRGLFAMRNLQQK